MAKKQLKYKPGENLQKQIQIKDFEIQQLQSLLEEANETIEAIRTGQIDALVVQGDEGHQLYTLRNADQTYRVFIEKMTEGAVTLNRQGIIVYSNTKFASMVNLSLSNVIGMSFKQFVTADDVLQYEKLFETGWGSDCKGEVYLNSEPIKMPVQLSLTALQLQEGLSLSIIVTDLSFQKDIQEQLKKNNNKLEQINKQLEVSNQDLLQFASVASHDLQEPIRKIQIYSNFLKKNETELSSESQKNLNKIIDSSIRMKALIIDILNYSRLSVNNTLIENIDLNEVIKELQDDFELIIEDKGASLHIGKLPQIEGNKGQIRQVFQNIIGNALKFSVPGKQPVIHIRSKHISDKTFESKEYADGDFCLISIKDNGIGFNEIYVDNVFALFERLNSKDKYEGTGIGMSIAKKIIEKHNGLITATGKEGIGAEFKIILPLKQNHI